MVGSWPGDGQRMKLVNQLLCGVHIAAAAEALAFAEALGLEAADCWKVLREGAAASFMFDDRASLRSRASSIRCEARWDISSAKDTAWVAVDGDQVGASVPLTATARHNTGARR